LRLSFDPFPEIRTANLILRKLRDRDLQDLYEIRKDPLMNLYVDNVPDRDISETLDYLERMNRGIEAGKWIIWALELKSEARLIGTLSIWNFGKNNLRGELGYCLDRRYQGQGFMTEALRAVINHAFRSLGLRSLLAYTDIRNQPSVKLLERCGFKKTGEFEEKGALTCRVFQMGVFELKV
jgi:ribosomal-protein-alanine N-acetyltransferase